MILGPEGRDLFGCAGRPFIKSGRCLLACCRGMESPAALFVPCRDTEYGLEIFLCRFYAMAPKGFARPVLFVFSANNLYSRQGVVTLQD